MADFNISLRTPTSPFNIQLSDTSPAVPSFSPPTINQIYARSDYCAGSSYGVTAGQIWPRGTGHQ